MSQADGGLEQSSPHPDIRRIVQMLHELPSRHPSYWFPEGNPEAVHVAADGLLLEALRQLGGGAVADAYEGLRTEVGGFWYA